MYALYAYHYRCELLALVLTYNRSQIQHILLITLNFLVPKLGVRLITKCAL